MENFQSYKSFESKNWRVTAYEWKYLKDIKYQAMNQSNYAENKRAERIAYRISQHHASLANLYECLVDRDFVIAEVEIKDIILDLRFILKSLEDDDF
jgi:hypothetical protein